MASSTTSCVPVRSNCRSTRSSSCTPCRTSPPTEFLARCTSAAQVAADADKAKLVTKRDDKATKLGDQLAAAQDRASVVAEQAEDRKRGNLLRAAGDLLGGLFGSRRNAAAKIGSAADQLTRERRRRARRRRPWQGGEDRAAATGAGREVRRRFSGDRRQMGGRRSRGHDRSGQSRADRCQGDPTRPGLGSRAVTLVPAERLELSLSGS